MCATVLSGTLLNCPVKPCPVLLLGRRWLIVSPAQKLRLGQPLNMKPVSHLLSWAGQSKWHLCAAQPVPPQHCCTATNVLERSKLGSLQQNEDRQAAHGVLHARDYAPQPLPKATAKLSPEQLGRVGESQLSTAADPPWHRTAPSSGTCWAMLGVVLWLLLHPTQSCSISAARRDSRSHLLRGQTHRRLLCEGSSEFQGLAVLNYESVN